jgi:phosphinothricin acetyltransferase
VSDVEIRQASTDDIPAMNAIYNRYIVGSHVSFDTEPWTDAQRLSWFQRRVSAGYPVLVACRDSTVIGASWSGPWRDKAAYRSTAETTVVLAPEAFGEGVGTKLYAALLEALRAAQFHVAIGIVALPNDASVALHKKLGYREVGTLEGVGLKDGLRHSTMILEAQLDVVDPPEV